MRVWGSPGRHKDAQRQRILARRAWAVERDRQWAIKDVDQALKRLREVARRGRDRLSNSDKDNAVSLRRLGFGGVVPIERLALHQLCNRDLRHEPCLVASSGGSSLQGEGCDA